MYHMIGARDVAGTVALMQRIGVHFGGSRSARVLHAVARDGVDRPDLVLIALASVGGVPRGLVVAFTRRATYWRELAWRHPLAALDLARHRIVRRLVRRLRPQARPARVDERIRDARALLDGRITELGRERWDDESSQIAKVMYVAIDPAHGKGGLGAGLYGWFFRWLRDHGYDRCDAHVSSDNVAAVRLHRKFPFRFIETHGGYFLWLVPSEVS